MSYEEYLYIKQFKGDLELIKTLLNERGTFVFNEKFAIVTPEYCPSYITLYSSVIASYYNMDNVLLIYNDGNVTRTTTRHINLILDALNSDFKAFGKPKEKKIIIKDLKNNKKHEIENGRKIAIFLNRREVIHPIPKGAFE